jgi:hypothetical protein
MAIASGQWPKMGQLIDVVYAPRNPDNWFFAPPAGHLPPPDVNPGAGH